MEWEEGSKIPKTDSRVAAIRILSKWALTVNTTNKWVDSNNLVTMAKCTDLCQECRHLHHTQITTETRLWQDMVLMGSPLV